MKSNVGLQVNYFPSRFDPVRHAERFPENRIPISGARERRMIDKVTRQTSSHVTAQLSYPLTQEVSRQV